MIPGGSSSLTRLYKEFLFQRLSYGTADGYENKEKTENGKHRQGIPRPEKSSSRVEGYIDEMVDQYGKSPESDHRAADDIKRALWEISHKRDHGGDDDPHSRNDRESEGKKPTAAIYQIYIQNEKSDGGKINGNEDNGIWSAEPDGQNKKHVGCDHASYHVSRPAYRTVYTDIADKRQQDRKQENDG